MPEPPTMRGMLFLLSLILALPSIALAAFFVVVGHAIATGSLIGFLGALLEVALWLLPWGLLACIAAFIALIVAGLSARWRWIASACVSALAIGSSIVALTLAQDSSPGQLAFFAPAAASAALGIWLASSEWPRGSSPRVI